jgi:hypothetical protein
MARNRQNNQNSAKTTIVMSGFRSQAKPKISEMRRQTKLCKNGPSCRFGKTCLFAHDESELVSLNEQYSNVYRTQPCKQWSASGHCDYGDKCFFVHLSSSPSPTTAQSAAAATIPNQNIQPVKQPSSYTNRYAHPRPFRPRNTSADFDLILADFESHMAAKRAKVEAPISLPPPDHELYLAWTRKSCYLDPNQLLQLTCH